MDCYTGKTIKKKVGSSRVYTFASIAIVDTVFRFTLACLPVGREDRREEVTRKQAEMARSLVGVDLVLIPGISTMSTSSKPSKNSGWNTSPM